MKEPIEHEATNLEFWAKAQELREMLKQMPPSTKRPEIESLEEALATLERLQNLKR